MVKSMAWEVQPEDRRVAAYRVLIAKANQGRMAADVEIIRQVARLMGIWFDYLFDEARFYRDMADRMMQYMAALHEAGHIRIPQDSFSEIARMGPQDKIEALLQIGDEFAVDLLVRIDRPELHLISGKGINSVLRPLHEAKRQYETEMKAYRKSGVKQVSIDRQQALWQQRQADDAVLLLTAWAEQQ